MLTQLRRSAVMVLICLVLFGLAYPLVGVGLSQLFFKHQADGSITANGSTRIGQNWSLTKCPGHLAGTCVFQGRPDAVGPLFATPASTPATTRPDTPVTTHWWPTAGRRVRGDQPRPTLEVLLDDTKALIAYWHSAWREPDLGPRDHLGERARPRHHPRRRPGARSRWWPAPPASRRRL